MDITSFFVHRNRANYAWEAEIKNTEGVTAIEDGHSVLKVTADDYREHLLGAGWELVKFTRDVSIIEVEYTAAAYAQALETLLWSSTVMTEDGDEIIADDRYGPWEIAEADRQELLSHIREMVQTGEVLEWIAEDGISADMFGHSYILSANGSGGGFPDRPYSNREELHELARVSSYELYIRNDGQLGIM